VKKENDIIQQSNGTAFIETGSESKQVMNLDKWDGIVAVSSGILTAALDLLWVGELSLMDAHKWGTVKTDAVVKKVAGSNLVNGMAKARKIKSFHGDDLTQAIGHLENLFPHAVDKSTNEFGGGLQHHLRDFGHHPTIIGLLFSLLTQFSGHGFGTDVHGNFICLEIKDKELIGKTPAEKIYLGTITWAFHLISDMAGSSTSAGGGKEGTGIPGPLLSLLKEISSMPGIRAIAGKNKDDHYNFSLACSKLFNGTLLGDHDEKGNLVKGGELRFDLRTEIGIGVLIEKQLLPILINEFIVRAFYAIRRFADEIQKENITCLSDLKKLDVSRFRPWNSKPLTRMLMISSTTFSVIDISAAGIKAAINNRNNKTGFALEFLQRINYCGVGRLALIINGEAMLAFGELQNKYLTLAKEQISRVQVLGLDGGEAASLLAKLANAGTSIAAIATPAGFISAAAGVYQQMYDSVQELEMAREERLLIEAECAERIIIIRENRTEMEQLVNSYMMENLQVFSEAFDEMDRAILNQDSDGFIGGNVKIQKQLGNNAGFENLQEFECLMLSDDSFKM